MEEKLPLITSVYINVTDKCNSKCRYCFTNPNGRSMSYETAKEVVHFLINNSKIQNDIPSINFFGGEPLLEWDSIVFPLIEYIRSELKVPFDLSMTSNFLLMSEEKMKYLSAQNVGLLFSVDGDKETQDYNRPCYYGESSFDLLAQTIRLIPTYYPNITFRSTLIPKTCVHMFDNMMFAKDCGYKNIFIVPNVFEEWSVADKAIAESELRKYSDYFITQCLLSIHPIRLDPLIQMFNLIALINQANEDNLYRTHARCLSCNKCGLGHTKFASVDCDGEIYACQEFSTLLDCSSIFKIGNITTGVDDFKRKQLNESFNIKPAHAASDQKCSDCLLDYVCSGGCAANNYMIYGTTYTNSPIHCWWQGLLLKEAIYIMQALGNKECEFFKNQYLGGAFV